MPGQVQGLARPFQVIAWYASSDQGCPQGLGVSIALLSSLGCASDTMAHGLPFRMRTTASPSSDRTISHA